LFFNEPFGGIIPGARGAVLAALLRTGTPLTGRQIHSLLSDDYSLWTVQEALKSLTKLGLVETQTIGRAYTPSTRSTPPWHRCGLCWTRWQPCEKRSAR
jgi:Fe2+ or Zn2+ uptake regulation protein